MRNELLAEINNNHNELISLVEMIDQKHLNVIPFENSWTSGQLIRHLIKSNSGFISLLNGPVKDLTGEKKPYEQVDLIRTTFLDFTTKLKSPEFVVPENKYYEKDILLNKLNDINLKLVESIMTLDLDKVCTGFEIPVLGYLTRLESIHFVISHTKRHIHQLENIISNLDKNGGSMQKINVFMMFNDQAEEAIQFYSSVFHNSKVLNKVDFGDSGSGTKVAGGTIEIGGLQIMTMNGGPYFNFSQGISLFVNCDTQEEIDELWEKLSEGGEKQQCGWVRDKFGVSWQIVPAVLNKMVQDPDRNKNVMEALLKMSKLEIKKLQDAYESAVVN